MTSPAGSVTLGVAVDAGDLASQLTREVMAAMGDVLGDVRGGVVDIERVLAGVDTSGLGSIADAASRASQSASQSISDIEQTAQRTSRTVGESMTNAARQASAGLARIDAGSLTAIVRGAESAGEELSRLDRWQLNDLIATANRAGQNLGQSVAAGASQAERSIGQLDAAGLERLIRDATDARNAIGQIDDEAGDIESSAGGIGSKFGEWGGAIAGAAAGLAGVTAAVDVISESIDRADAGKKLQAQLNLSPEESAKAGRIAGDLFAQNYGESFADVEGSLGSVTSALGNFTDDSDEALAGLTKNALDLSTAFDVDVAESAQSANNLIRNGLAKDGTEAFDLITTAMQRVPEAMRGEILPIIDEYAVSFNALGIDGQSAMGIIVDAAQGGAIAIDKAGDAVKEFSIRATDLGDTGAQEALTALGFSGQDMANKLLAGGDVANGAFNEIVGGLQGIKDPAEQAAAATALFGTPLEDMSKDKIPAFLDGLAGGTSAMAGFEGSASQMGDTLGSGPMAAIEGFKRGLQNDLVAALGSSIEWMQNNEGVAKALAIVIGSVAAVLLTTAGAIGIYNLGLKAVEIGTRAWSTITTIATAVQRGFTAAFIASPIGLVAVAIAGLVAGLALFFTKTELGRQVFETLKNAVVVAWEAIKGAVMSAWEFIQPILAGIGSFITDTLVPAFMNFYTGVIVPVFQGIGAAISFAWNNVVLPIFNAYKTVIEGVIIPVLLFLWNNVVVPVFQGIGDVISGWWNGVVLPVFNAVKTVIEGIVIPLFMFFYNNVIIPVFQGIGDFISFSWNNVILPIFNAIGAFLGFLGEQFMGFWHNVVEPVWNGIGAAIGFVIDNVVSPGFDRLKGALSVVGDFFRTTVEGIGTVWNGIRNLLAKPINFMIGTVYNNGIAKAWNKVAEFVPGLITAPQLDLIPEYKTGGPISGPAGPDKVLAWNTAGEHMFDLEDVRRAGGHAALFAIRDMIMRGVPFEWNNGKVRGLDNSTLTRYGNAVQAAGIGNVPPEGLFDPLFKIAGDKIPGYKDGGVIEPWMDQLLKGHDFARAQHGKAYQWAGPTGPGSSFDCSGFMGSIAAVILGGNPWQRYWSTASFGNSQRSSGPQGFVAGLDNGFSIGVTDDPGGPGGGHTAGTLGALPLLGIGSPVNVESGGALGDVHYGGGTNPESFSTQYHLPIGANGFFEAGLGTGVGNAGPSPEDQRSFIARKANDIFDGLLSPIRAGIVGAIGSPPPEWVGIPPKFLDIAAEKAANGVGAVVDGLGDLLSSTWRGAQSAGRAVLDAINPFDSGGLARGTGMMPKDVIAPERVLSPEQTRMFELLVTTLDKISGSANNLVNTGNYDGGLAKIGIEEDNPIVDAVLSVRDAVVGGNELIENGNYDGRLNQFGIAEDSPIVDAVLTARDAAVGAEALIRDGDFTSGLSRVGIDEDSPLVNAVLSVREAVLTPENNPVVDAVNAVHDATVSTNAAVTSGNTAIPQGLADVLSPILGTVGDVLGNVSKDLVTALTPAVKPIDKIADRPVDVEFMNSTQAQIDAQGRLISETQEIAKRTSSSTEQVVAEQFAVMQNQLVDIANRLTGGVLGPVVQTAMQSALGVVDKALVGATAEITDAQGETTAAVKGIDVGGGGTSAAAAPFGAPGSAFDAASAISDAIVSVANTAQQSIMQVGQDVAKAALSGGAKPIDNPKGILGDAENSGGYLVDTLVRLTGVQIQVRDFMEVISDDMRKFWADSNKAAFDASGQLLSDTTSILERTSTSTELAIAEQGRIQKELLKALLRYLVSSVLIPILTAMMTAIITLVTTAIGAMAGSLLGPIGAAVGAAAGAAVGVALGAVAATVIGGVGLVAGAGIDAFDSGGIAHGIGVMPKNTIAPERVLSPRQTSSFERLVDALEAGKVGNTSKIEVHAPFNVSGGESGAKTVNTHLLSLLNS